MKQIITDFHKDCQARGLAKKTVQNYIGDVKDFIKYNPDPTKVSNKELVRYLNLLRDRDLKTNTISKHFTSISQLYDYLIFTQKHDENPTIVFRKRYIRNKRKFNDINRRQLIDIQTMRRLISEPFNVKRKTLIKKYIRSIPERDHAMMMMFAKTGIRREELRCMELDALNIQRKAAFINPSFGKRTNCIVFLDDETIQAIEIYLKWRQENVSENNN